MQLGGRIYGVGMIGLTWSVVHNFPFLFFISHKNATMTEVTLLPAFCKVVFTTSMPSSFGIFEYNDLTSNVTRQLFFDSVAGILSR